MQNLDFILRLSSTNISLLVIKKIDFDDKKTNVFYKSLSNENKFNLNQQYNITSNILKTKIFSLINDAKRDLCISHIDKISVSYCFDSFKTSKHPYNSFKNKLNLDNLIKDQSILKIKDYTLLNFYVNHHIENQQKTINLYWIPTTDYENIINILKEVGCSIKQFIVSNCFINYEFISSDKKTILIHFENEKTKTLLYSGIGLVEEDYFLEIKNHLNVKEIIKTISNELNLNFQFLEKLFYSQNYSDEQILHLSLDNNSIFKTIVIKVKDIKQKIKDYLNAAFDSIEDKAFSKENTFLYFKSNYYFFDIVFDEWASLQTKYHFADTKRFENNHSKEIFECMNDYIKMIIINN